MIEKRDKQPPFDYLCLGKIKPKLVEIRHDNRLIGYNTSSSPIVIKILIGTTCVS